MIDTSLYVRAARGVRLAVYGFADAVTLPADMPEQELRIAGQLVLPAGPDAVRLSPGCVTLSGDRIAAVDEGEEAMNRADLGGPGFLVSPGFIDVHVHLPQFDSIGVPGLELLEWLDRVIFPAEARWADADYAGQMTTRVAQQLLSFGTTTVAAYATVHHDAARAAMAALAGAGLSGFVGQVLMDRGAPPELCRPASEAIPQAAGLTEIGSIRPAVTPRFAISCTDEMLRRAGELAARTGWLVQTHLAETEAECREVGRLFGGLGYVEVYRRAGLLGPRTILGHGIHLNKADRAVLAERRAVVAHCPTANRFLRAGTMSLAKHRAAGVHVAVGSDVAGGPDRSMVRVARAMLEAAESLGQAALSAAEVWALITQGNARHLGLAAELGSLERGRRADVVLIRPEAGWERASNPLAGVLYGWDDRWVEGVWAGGATSGRSRADAQRPGSGRGNARPRMSQRPGR